MPGKTVAELLAAYRERTGHSYRDIARLSSMSVGAVSDLANGPQGWPKTIRTVTALADLLGVPPRTVVLAYAAGLGLDVEADDLSWMPPGADRLAGEDRDLVRALVRRLLSGVADVAPEPALEEAWDSQSAYRLAARHGVSEGRRLREEQDDTDPA